MKIHRSALGLVFVISFSMAKKISTSEPISSAVGKKMTTLGQEVPTKPKEGPSPPEVLAAIAEEVAQQPEQADRYKKSATTFCVEIRPSPSDRPVKVCDNHPPAAPSSPPQNEPQIPNPAQHLHQESYHEKQEQLPFFVIPSNIVHHNNQVQVETPKIAQHIIIPSSGSATCPSVATPSQHIIIPSSAPGAPQHIVIPSTGPSGAISLSQSASTNGPYPQTLISLFRSAIARNDDNMSPISMDSTMDVRSDCGGGYALPIGPYSSPSDAGGYQPISSYVVKCNPLDDARGGGSDLSCGGGSSPLFWADAQETPDTNNITNKTGNIHRLLPVLNKMPTNTEEGFATKAIHAGQDPQQWSHCAVVPPLVMSTTFSQTAPAQHCGFEYGRSGNPTRNVLESCLAALENGKHGFTFASGLGATTAVTSLLAAGDHIVCGDDIYGGTNRYFRQCASKNGIKISFVDSTNVKNVMNALGPDTKMVWLETPTNPMLKLVDIKAVAEALKAARPEIILVVDNTFLTCYFQRPLDLGADIVMYSLTKYMNGHSDVIMGAAITRSDELEKRLRFIQNAMGIVPSPFDCMQVNRSLKTLEVRMKQHMKNGLAVAKFLENHPQVEKVMHPLLPSHPQHELALRQTDGHSGMISFYHKGDSFKFLKSLKLFTLAESLGGYESLAELPSVMTHASVPAEDREQLGITDQLIRLSVGLETEQDLLADLDQALKASQK